jgi:hypothetical protein
MRTALASVVGLMLTATMAFADPVGEYEVHGTNPGGGGSYSGTVTVDKTGDTYRVVWNIGGTRYVGTGIGDKNFIAVSYRSGNNTGLALYGSKGENFEGVWAYSGSRQMGTEVWERQ